MRIALIAIVLIGSIVALGAPGLTQPATDDLLIVPGQRIGLLRVGMSITDAAAVMGTPKPANTKIVSVVLPVPVGATAFEWPPSSEAQRQGAGPHDGFAVITDKAGMVYEIQSTFDRRYHTVEGVHVGSKLTDVTNAFGAPTSEKTSGHERLYVYDQRGIVILFQDNRQISNYGLVNGFWVLAPRATP